MSDDFKKALLVGVLGVMAILFLLFVTGCHKKPATFEDHVCTHLADILGQKEINGLHEACVNMVKLTAAKAEAQGEGEKYRDYLECLEAAPTFSQAQTCRAITGWDAQ